MILIVLVKGLKKVFEQNEKTRIIYINSNWKKMQFSKKNS